MKRSLLVLPLVAAVTVPALAHDGVKNPQVMARMQLMSSIGDQTKVLGNMAKGKTAFDAAAANAALAQLTQDAGQIATAFAEPATDPKSESKPEIWTNFDDFIAKADTLGAAAASVQVTAPADVGAALGALGQTCKSCHADYRAK